jgi:hypothetical protein
MPWNNKKSTPLEKKRKWQEIAGKVLNSGKPSATAENISNSGAKKPPSKKKSASKMAFGPKGRC